MITEKDILKIISEKISGIDLEIIKSKTEFSDVGIDSLDHAVILLALDEEFGIKIADNDVDKCNSIDNILCYMKEI